MRERKEIANAVRNRPMIAVFLYTVFSFVGQFACAFGICIDGDYLIGLLARLFSILAWLGLWTPYIIENKDEFAIGAVPSPMMIRTSLSFACVAL
jgi:hypothetical protein